MAHKKKNTIKSSEDFLVMSQRHSDLYREVQFAETSMNEEIDRIKAKYQEQLSTQTTELKATGILLEHYVLENIDTLTSKDKRSFETTTMLFSLKKGRVIKYPKTIQELVILLKKSPFHALIQRTEKVDKNKLKELDTSDLEAIGLSVKEEVDHLTMTVKTEEIL